LQTSPKNSPGKGFQLRPMISTCHGMTLRGTIAGCADSCWLCVALMCAGYVLPGGFLPALCCLNVCRSCVAGRGALRFVLPNVCCRFVHSLIHCCWCGRCWLNRLLAKISKEFTRKGVSIKPNDIYMHAMTLHGAVAGCAVCCRLYVAECVLPVVVCCCLFIGWPQY